MRPATAGILATLALSLTLVPSPRPAFAAVGSDGRFTSYLGGTGMETARAVAVDSTGAIFVVGSTTSTDFPVKNALNGSLAGGADAFVAKLASDGRTVLWATYLGGSGDDLALCVAPDSTGAVWVGGETTSPDFPTHNPLQAANAGGKDGFLVRLTADGGSFLFSTYLGGTGDDGIAALGLDGAGDAWVAGTTASADLPVTSDAFQTTYGGADDAFLAEFSPDGAALLHATFLGGAGGDGALALAVEPAGMVTVAGYTGSDDFPTAGALQDYLAGGNDAFVLRYDGKTATVAFSTYFGGSGDDAARAIAYSPQGILAIAGTTVSSDLPVSGALQPSFGGVSDAFVLSLTSDGTTLRYATYLGGSGEDEARAVSLASDGTAIVAGMTTSVDFPVVAGAQTGTAGGKDGFLVRVSRSGQAFDYASYLGGSSDDAVNALALDAADVPVVGGVTGSGDLGLLLPFQAASGGADDAIVGRILASLAPPTGLAIRSMSATKVTINWVDPTDGRASFEVQKMPAGDAWATIATLDPGTTSTTDTDVLALSNYRYRVRAALDGVASAYSAEITASTPAIPAPATPGTPVLSVETAGRILVQWEDLSDNEITFEVFRGVDGGPFSIVQSLSADTNSWEDVGVTADRTWSYEVRAVGVTGPSGISGAATASTPSTISLDGVVGKRVDVAHLSHDSLALSARFSVSPGGGAFDPRAGGFQVGVGDATAPAVLTVQPGSDGWKERGGVFTWKSPKGSTAKVTLVVDTVRGTVRLKATRLELGSQASGEIRSWIRSGTDAGSTTSPWTEKKPGVLVCK
jgi:hypothetical protein